MRVRDSTPALVAEEWARLGVSRPHNALENVTAAPGFLPRRKGVLFWEAKGPKGKQSDSQVLVEARCAQAGVGYVCGGLVELESALRLAGLLA